MGMKTCPAHRLALPIPFLLQKSSVAHMSNETKSEQNGGGKRWYFRFFNVSGQLNHYLVFHLKPATATTP